MYILLVIEENLDNSHPPLIMQQFFKESIPNEIPLGLPPMRDIQYHIDLVIGIVFLNKETYRMSLREPDDLKRKVEELVTKGLARETMSPCVVPTLFVSKKDGT